MPCDDREAAALCVLLHVKFQAAIRAGMIRVLKKFWGWRLSTLRNWDDAERYAQEHGLGEHEGE